MSLSYLNSSTVFEVSVENPIGPFWLITPAFPAPYLAFHPLPLPAPMNICFFPFNTSRSFPTQGHHTSCSCSRTTWNSLVWIFRSQLQSYFSERAPGPPYSSYLYCCLFIADCWLFSDHLPQTEIPCMFTFLPPPPLDFKFCSIWLISGTQEELA